MNILDVVIRYYLIGAGLVWLAYVVEWMVRVW